MVCLRELNPTPDLRKDVEYPPCVTGSARLFGTLEPVVVWLVTKFLLCKGLILGFPDEYYTPDLLPLLGSLQGPTSQSHISAGIEINTFVTVKSYSTDIGLCV